MATNTTSSLSFLTFLIISYLISTVQVITVTEARALQATTVSTGNLMDCWNAALELKSCTDEIVKFFLNQTAMTEPVSSGLIDGDCCGAIGLTEEKCWSVLFTSLGLTPMEGNNLREYCDVQADKQEFSPSPAPESWDLSPVEISDPGLD